MPEQQNHIFVIEDELVIAQILHDYIVQAGYKCTQISDGSKVIPKVKELNPDLILLDLMLPGKNGIDICREIRQFSTVPIIMVTAKIEEIDRLLGLELGADDYICKPFSPREVVARVKAMFRRNLVLQEQNEQKSKNKEDDKLVIIDEAQARITVNGIRLDLTPTEYRLLKLLSNSPGRVYSRDQLLNLCYQQEQMIYDRVIDSHIKNLRKKLEKVLPGKELIHSVYGLGYRYEEEY